MAIPQIEYSINFTEKFNYIWKLRKNNRLGVIQPSLLYRKFKTIEGCILSLCMFIIDDKVWSGNEWFDVGRNHATTQFI